MQMERIGMLQDFAAMSNGRFFDAGVVMPNLLDEIQKEIGNFYVLGFTPPEGGEGRFHNIDVRTKDSSYRVIHRSGYFGKKRFERLSGKERAIHLEEGFLMPGLVNELNLKARGVRLPLRVDPTALVSFSIDSATIGEKKNGSREIEVVLNLEDRQGRIRYRVHKTFKASRGRELPEQLWWSLNIPLEWDACAVFLGVRDNATGARATWRHVFDPVPEGRGTLLVADPMFMIPESEGRLTEWAGQDARDGVKPVEPLRPAAVEIEGRLLADNTIPQGGEAQLLLLLGRLPADVDPRGLEVDAQFALDPTTDNALLIRPTDREIQYLDEHGVLMLSFTLPLGLAQQPSGDLVAAIRGVISGRHLLASSTYRITQFSHTKALELRDDPNIQDLK
jgi:hypothetical protein